MCLIIYSISTYNKLIKMKENVDNAWSQIDVQLKRRYDLIPNLVETVKGYATHEKETLSRVTEARASVGSAKTTQEAVEANNQLSSALARLLVVSEKYPELKANVNFTSLQGELSAIENKIAFTRQSYNDTVGIYNKKKKSFPANIVAKIFKFEDGVYYKAEEVVQSAPVVKF
ncbi:MAG: LemA family protein [Clostridia bacterium]|nr:LemA family protein [Clostridia bacterium]